MIFRVVNIRKKYACKACEETILTAKLPKQPIDKAIAAAGLLAAIIDAKFNRHMPLYRQEAMFAEANISITRGTLTRREQDAKPVILQIKAILDEAQFKVVPQVPWVKPFSMPLATGMPS